MLSALALTLLAQCSLDGPIYSCPSTMSQKSFQLALQYLYPYPGVTGQARLPTPSSAARAPKAIIRVNTGTGCIEAIGPGGAVIGTVTNDTCTGNVTTHIGSSVLGRDISHAGGDSPVVTSATIDALFGGSSAYTVIVGGTLHVNGDGFYWLLHRNGGTSGYFDLYSDGGGNMRCGRQTADNPVAGAVPFKQYVAWACSRDGATSFKATYQTASSTTVSAPAEPAIAGTGGWYIYNRVAGDFGGNGIFVFAAFFDVELTAAEKADYIDAYEGDANPGKLLSYRNSQAVAVDHLSTTGLIDMMGDATVLVDGNGLMGSVGFTNKMAAGSTLGAAGTDVGTPTVTAAVYAGPYSVSERANECDLVVDDDATAGTGGEGKLGLDMGTDLIDYNDSVVALQGTSGTTRDKVTLFCLAPSGTVTPATAVVTLGSTPQRLSSIFRISGSPTSVKCGWYVGDTPQATGSVRICQAQTTKGPALEPAQPNGSIVSPIYYTADLATDGAPVAANGMRVEAIHTAGYSSSIWLNNGLYEYRVVDPFVAGPAHAGALIHNYTALGTFYAQGLLTNAISTTVNTLYASSWEQVPTNGGFCNTAAKFNACAVAYDGCHATTQVNADATGTSVCTGTPTNAQFLAREDGTGAGSFHVSAITFYAYR